MYAMPRRSDDRSDAAPKRRKYAFSGQVQAFSPERVLGPLPLDVVLRTPNTLYAAGDLGLLGDVMRVSIIGARSASEDGLKRARKLATQLAREHVVVVSGLAKGIDRAAHDGALAVGGRTIAVIGTPLDKCYPAEHSELQQQLCEEQLVVSQFAIGTRTYPSSFIARNRTMALLSHVSVIVEAGDTSGSLSQAAETQRLGKKLFLMESVLRDTKLTWPDKFLQAGAIALRDVQQIFDAV